MYKKILQYIASISMFTTVFALSNMAMAAYYPTQAQTSPYTPTMCQDNGTVYSNKRYYKGATFYPYDTMYGSTNVGWALDRASSHVYIYNPFASFTIQGPLGGFLAKSNSKPVGVSEVLAASNDSGTVVNGPTPSTATTLGMQLVYNIVRKPLVAGSGAPFAWGAYIQALANGTFGPMTSWTWTNWAYGSAQQWYECANYYVSRCGDGIVDNGGAVPAGTPLVDQFWYPLWTNGNTPNAGEECDLGSQNGQPGRNCTAACKNAPVSQNPDLAIVKSIVGNTTGYQSGNTITYQLLYTNIGTGLATQVTIADALPAGVTYVANSATSTPNIGQPTVVGSNLTWNLTSLAPGAAGTITFQVKLTQYAACTPYTNISTIAAINEPSTLLANNTSSATFTTICPQPDVITTKSVTAISGSYMPGNEVEYTLTYSNIGNVVANGVIVTDTLPSQVAYVTTVSSNPNIGNPVITTVSGFQTLTWTIGTLAPGASGQIKIRAKININVATCTNVQINNKFTIFASNEATTLLGNNTSYASFPIQCIDLRSTKVVDKPTVVSGDIVTYTVAYGNSGNLFVATGQIIDILPLGTTYVSGSTTSTPNIGQPTVTTLSGGNQQLTWNVSNLMPGFVGGIQFKATISQEILTQTYTNNVCITGDGLNPNGIGYFNNNNCDDATSVSLNDFIDLSIVKSPSTQTVNIGSNVTFNLTVTNNGTTGVNNFSVKDYLPIGLDFVSAAPSATYDTGTRTITRTGLSLWASASTVLTVVTTYNSSQTVTNWTEVCNYNGIGTGAGQNPSNPYDIDSNPCNGTGNNEDDVSSAVVNPIIPWGWGPTMDIQLTKLVNGVSTYSADNGETVTFTLRVSNEGNTAPGAPVTVIDYLPANVEYVAGTATPNTLPVTFTYDGSGRRLIWSGIVLSNNDFKTLTFQAKYNDNVARTNYAEVCHYNGISQNDSGVTPTNAITNPADIDSNPCNNGANSPTQDDEAQATITPKTGWGGCINCGWSSRNRCGDGLVARPNSYGQYEECDLWDAYNGKPWYNCTLDCKTISVVGSCGNYVVDAGEVCDRGPSGWLILTGAFAGRQCNSSCGIPGRQAPTCAYVDPPSIQQGEYLPYRWDIESNVSTALTVASCRTAGQIVKDSVQCEFTVTNAKWDTLASWIKGCDDKETSNLRTSAHSQSMTSLWYTAGNYPAMNGWSTRQSPATFWWLGEHKMSMKVINFKTCSQNAQGTWEAVSNVNTNQRVCEMNFAVTKPYMVSRGPLGNFATDGLNTFLQFPDGDKIFPTPLSPITQKFDVTQVARDSVNTLLNAYDKLAVTAGTLPGTTTDIKKVPGKDIFVVDANGGYITIGDNTQNATNAKPFTLIVKNGSLVIKGDLIHSARGMYIVPNGNIEFAMNSCNTKQSVQGIFITLQNITSLNQAGTAWSIHNTDLGASRCSAGDLTINGVLVGNNVATMTNLRRSNVNNWFNDISTLTQPAQRQENLLDRGAVVLKYNTDIFNNLPPGAEVLSQVLNVYKK